MAPWDLHEMYHALAVNDIPKYPTRYNSNYITNVLKFDGDPSSTIDHIAKFIEYASEINLVHEDALMKLFINSLGIDQREWIIYSCGPGSISSIKVLIEKFLMY